MRNKLIIVIFISLFCFAHTATAQKLINSPYSRFNIGTLEPQGSFRSLGMGGIGTAMRDNSSIYFTNPASYSSLDTIHLCLILVLIMAEILSPMVYQNIHPMILNFHHLIMGFPLTKGWGFALGVVPLSSGYYKITRMLRSTDPDYDPNIGEYSIAHTGDGGINKFFLGTGVQIGKNFSVGANMTFLSGQISRTNQFDIF